MFVDFVFELFPTGGSVCVCKFCRLVFFVCEGLNNERDSAKMVKGIWALLAIVFVLGANAYDYDGVEVIEVGDEELEVAVKKKQNHFISFPPSNLFRKIADPPIIGKGDS